MMDERVWTVGDRIIGLIVYPFVKRKRQAPATQLWSGTGRLSKIRSFDGLDLDRDGAVYGAARWQRGGLACLEQVFWTCSVGDSVGTTLDGGPTCCIHSGDGGDA